MSVRAKLAATFLGLLAIAILATSGLEIEHATRVQVADLIDSGQALVKQIFQQMRTALKHGGNDPAATLATDDGLRTLLDSSLAFGKGVVYVSIEGADGRPIASAGREPSIFAVQPVEVLIARTRSWLPLVVFRSVFSNQVFEVQRAVSAGGRPFAVIKVGLSTGLIAAEVRHSAWVIASVAAAILLLASLGVAVLGRLLLAPVLAVTAGIQSLTRGAQETEPRAKGGDELATLAEKFDELSRQVRSDRVRWETERGQLFSALRSIADAVLLLDAHGLVLFANAEALGRLGLPAGGISEGKSLAMLLGKGHPLVRIVNAAYATGAEVRDAPLEISSGERAERFVVSVFALGQAREPAGMLVILRDLGPVRELEEVMDYSGRLARLGGLISGVAHQIRNPLHAMNLQLELLLGELDGAESAQQRIASMRREIRRLDSAVQALMRFMRPEELRLSLVPINSLVQELGNQIADSRCEVKYELDPEVGAIRVDRALLTEALKNLIQNALDAMPEGGTLTLSTAAREDATIEIQVADTGIGIPPEDLKKIFNLYYTTKSTGNGLGLPMALRAVDLHRGTLRVESRVGVGTKFTLRLPSDLEEPGVEPRAAVN